MSITDPAPRLSRSEWQSVAAALREADQRDPADHPALDAVRRFTSLIRRHRRPVDECRPVLAQAGFNDRQIAALALLSI